MGNKIDCHKCPFVFPELCNSHGTKDSSFFLQLNGVGVNGTTDIPLMQVKRIASLFDRIIIWIKDRLKNFIGTTNDTCVKIALTHQCNGSEKNYAKPLGIYVCEKEEINNFIKNTALILNEEQSHGLSTISIRINESKLPDLNCLKIQKLEWQRRKDSEEQYEKLLYWEKQKDLNPENLPKRLESIQKITQRQQQQNKKRCDAQNGISSSSELSASEQSFSGCFGCL